MCELFANFLFVTDDLPGNFIPMPKPPTGKPTGFLTGGCDCGVKSSEGVCSSERGFFGGRTRGFLTAIFDFCGEESNTYACTCNGPQKQRRHLQF